MPKTNATIARQGRNTAPSRTVSIQQQNRVVAARTANYIRSHRGANIATAAASGAGFSVAGPLGAGGAAYLQSRLSREPNVRATAQKNALRAGVGSAAGVVIGGTVGSVVSGGNPVAAMAGAFYGGSVGAGIGLGRSNTWKAMAQNKSRGSTKGRHGRRNVRTLRDSHGRYAGSARL